MITVDELREAIEKGFIKGKTVSVVRRNNQIHDYVLSGEKVEPWETVKEEYIENILEELRNTNLN
ncbi:competence regulator inhibitor paratox [Streptococcus raffinosi]|uniref:Paratox n=1 Tax=Streptococcus raffinosi TaxID=3053355 RepID=A0ABT7LQI6_9STRE|nr:Paratox [Streptococcus sp. VTCC 12812]MDL5042914.1 Paratox [Streptococcus sp. VTCC 12812]